MDDIFTETETTTQEQEEKSYDLNEFMGEGKKYKTQNDVAKAIVHKDTHIQKLESEMQQLREELNKRISVEEALTRLKEEAKSSASNQGHNPDESESEEHSSESTFSKEDLERLIEGKLSTLTESQKKAANLQQVLQKAQDVWGQSANVEINKKAKELGMSVAELKGHAETNPNVFYRLVGLNQEPQTFTGNRAQPSVDTSKFQGTSGSLKNESYYKRLLKENPRDYFSPKVQNEMHQNAMKLGEKFFE